MSNKEHHWDFVDEDGCLHCNCSIGVIEPTPGSHPISPEKIADIAAFEVPDSPTYEELEEQANQMAGTIARLTLEIEGLHQELADAHSAHAAATALLREAYEWDEQPDALDSVQMQEMPF